MSAPRRRVGWTAVLALMWASPIAAQRQNTEAAIEAAQAGGVVLLCRHAITARMNEVEPVDYADSSTQRLLSAEGERQSAQIGEAMRALQMPPVEVVASPMHRARRTAELMGFARPVVIDSAWHTNGTDFSGPPMQRRAAVLSTPVEGGNRLIVSHIGTMRSALGEIPGNVEEGDCVVVRPEPGGHEVVGVVPWRAWLRATRRELMDVLEARLPISKALRMIRYVSSW